MLEASGLVVEDVALGLQVHDELQIHYRARQPIQSVTIRGRVEIT